MQAYSLARAKQANIPAHLIKRQDFLSREAFEQILQRQIDAYHPDLIVLAGYVRILTAGFVHHYTGKILNIHPSLLPKYPGLHTYRRVIEVGDKEHAQPYTLSQRNWMGNQLSYKPR